MRIWEVPFQVYKKMESLPRPGEVVKEAQNGPEYRMEGRKRVGSRGGQLAVTLSGEGGFSLDGRESRMLPGDAFLALHSDPRHAYFYPEDGREPWIFLWISFFGSAGDALIREFNERYGYLYHLPLDEGVVRQLDMYRNYGESVQALTPAGGGRLIMDLFCGLEDSKRGDQLKESRFGLVKQVEDHVIEHVGDNVGVNEIAERLSVSREHLSRLFKQQTGVPLQKYVLYKKMRLACHLLRETNLSCKEIAERIGYDNSSSFSRCFKNVTKVSPNDFRMTGYVPHFL